MVGGQTGRGSSLGGSCGRQQSTAAVAAGSAAAHPRKGSRLFRSSRFSLVSLINSCMQWGRRGAQAQQSEPTGASRWRRRQWRRRRRQCVLCCLQVGRDAHTYLDALGLQCILPELQQARVRGRAGGSGQAPAQRGLRPSTGYQSQHGMLWDAVDVSVDVSVFHRRRWGDFWWQPAMRGGVLENSLLPLPRPVLAIQSGLTILRTPPEAACC